jgi:opacity protein-like surface antigen
MKFEYLYYDLGNEKFPVNIIFAPPPVAAQAAAKVSGNIVRVGVNFRY